MNRFSENKHEEGPSSSKPNGFDGHRDGHTTHFGTTNVSSKSSILPSAIPGMHVVLEDGEDGELISTAPLRSDSNVRREKQISRRIHSHHKSVSWIHIF